VVEQLSRDLKDEFPGASGFSVQNLWYTRQLFTEYRHLPDLQQLVGEIPWGQNLLILQRVKDDDARKYYLKATAEMGWSRNVLLNQIKAKAYKRHQLNPKQHNFEKALPVHRVHDHYLVDFFLSAC